MKTGKAIKKPIPVEFYKLEPTERSIAGAYKFVYNDQIILKSTMDHLKFSDYCDFIIRQGCLPLKTLESGEGTQNANFGDYILKGIDGECWPVKPDIFERTYDVII